jgi:hypothetical protein
MTEWKPVYGYEDCYAVSDDGQLARTLTYGSKPKPRWKICAPRPKKFGYITYHLSKDGIAKDKLAHKLVWEAFKGPVPKGLELNHKDSVRSNPRLDNLELMTRSQNVAYGFSHNNRPSPNNPSPGSKCGASKLIESDIPKIFELSRSGKFLTEIAKLYGVTPTTIQYIIKRKTWRHVEVATSN